MSPTRKRILVTGVYGLIAGEVYLHVDGRTDEYEALGLGRRRKPSVRVADDRVLEVPEDRFFTSDLSAVDVLTRAMEGVDTVVHMAATPDGEADWETVLQSNVIGTRNVYEAAAAAGVKRVVAASSLMVYWGYLMQDEPFRAINEGRYDDIDPADIPMLDHRSEPRPTSYYPASKVWAESLGRYYADLRGISVLCLRIGWVTGADYPANDTWGRSVWCSQRDIVQAVMCCVEAPTDLQYGIFNAISDNKYRFVDLEHARKVIGYQPQDSADAFFE